MNATKEYKILVIDDSTTNVVLLEAVLDGKGYNINTALNAKEAYKILAGEDHDLILLDLLMPKISGFDFLEEFRKDDKNKDVPVIVISAVTDKVTVDKIMEMGATDFIKKPVDIGNLVEKVQTYLK